jgi:hypothetical protein
MQSQNPHLLEVVTIHAHQLKHQYNCDTIRVSQYSLHTGLLGNKKSFDHKFG